MKKSVVFDTIIFISELLESQNPDHVSSVILLIFFLIYFCSVKVKVKIKVKV